MQEEYLDCKGLRCPMPIVRISQALKAVPVGTRLRIEATDPAFGADIQAWTGTLGHSLLELEDGAIKTAVVEKR